MNSPTHYRSLRTGALYRFVAHTNTGNFAWFERQDTGEQVRLWVASLKAVHDLPAPAAAQLEQLMTTKHTPTPGPWRVDVAQYDDGTIRSVDVREAQYGLFIAAVEAHTTEHVDVMANARLIAAAPELLAALQRLTNRLEHHGSIGIDNHCLRQEFDQARAALAKADGTDSGLEVHRREKAREAAADLAEERDAIASWRNRG